MTSAPCGTQPRTTSSSSFCVAKPLFPRLRRTHAPDDRPIRIVDTFPPNYHYLGLIQLVLPRARIIHCTRDPFDNLLYCYFKNFKSVVYAFDQIELGEYYLHLQELMAHWHKVLPRPNLEVRYEELIADPVAQSRRIYEYCGLNWDEAFARDDGEFPITVRKGEVGRAQHYARHLGPLFDVLTGIGG